MPEEMINEEKETVWQKIKRWIKEKVKGAVIISAIAAGGTAIIVGVNPDHKEGQIYVIDPRSGDSLWYTDTLEAKEKANELSKIKVVSEKPVEYVKTDKIYDTLGVFIKDTAYQSTYIERVQARMPLTDSICKTFKIDDVVKAELTCNGKYIGECYYKIKFPPSVGILKMDFKD